MHKLTVVELRAKNENKNTADLWCSAVLLAKDCLLGRLSGRGEKNLCEACLFPYLNYYLVVDKDLPRVGQSKDDLCLSRLREGAIKIVTCYVETARVFVCSLIGWNVREPNRVQLVVLIYFFSHFHISAANCRIWRWKWWRCRSCFLSFSYRQTKKEVTQVHFVWRCFISLCFLLRTFVWRTATEGFTESWSKTELRFGDV